MRRLTPALAIAAIVVAMLAAVLTGPVVGQVRSGGAAPMPLFGTQLGFSEINESGTFLMGASSSAVGEAWAIGGHPKGSPVPSVNGVPLEFSPSEPGNPQTVFYRHTGQTGWQAVDTPRAADDSPIRQLAYVHESASITASGGGVVLGEVDNDDAVLIRDREGSFTRKDPQSPILLPSERTVAQDLTRAPAAAYDASASTTGAFVATIGAPAETILHFDGSSWARETVTYPAGMEADFRIIAIAAKSADNAWFAAETSAVSTRGIMIFKRTSGGTWVEQSLGSSKFADAATPTDGISDLRLIQPATLSVGANPLTLTEAGIWIDGSFELDSTRRTFTAFFDFSDAQVTGSWCDAVGNDGPVCDRPLGVELSTSYGYRSTAWSGGGYGQRVISNPVDRTKDDSTNHGTYLKLSGSDFLRMPAAGFEQRATTALFGEDAGFIGPETELSDNPQPSRLAAWSVGSRSPFVDVAPEPGKPTAGLDARALAVGNDGSVSRYQPGEGWLTEYLQTANGFVTRPDLRAVAWPEPARAHAVGEDGAMWSWRSETNLWQRDPGAPIGIETHLTDVAFDPSDPEDGYVVGREGVLLKYGKSWERVCATAGAFADCGSERIDAEFANKTFRGIAYAGGRPLAIAGPDVLVNDGGHWKADAGFRALIQQLRTGISGSAPDLLTVAGLPDGGAFVAGSDGMAFKRDSATAPWKAIDQPLKSLPIVAAGLFREGGQLRAVVSVANANYPPTENIDQPVPGQPAPFLNPLEQPADGLLLRETSTGWNDETRFGFSSPTSFFDRPAKLDPVRGVLLGSDGNGWVVGGELGLPDLGNRGTEDSSQRAEVRTASIMRYQASGASPDPVGAAIAVPVAQPSVGVGFVVGGHATCATRKCSYGAYGGLAPDRNVEAAVALTAKLSTLSNGPRFFAYTGGRLPTDGSATMIPREAQRLAGMLSASQLPTFSAVSEADSVGGDTSAYADAFASFSAPFGTAAPQPGIVPRGAGAGTRTHYSFDSTGQTGRIRVIVIDNSRGSLAASDPYQNPAVASQKAWLGDELDQAKSEGIPAVVIGSRDLNASSKQNVATDATEIAEFLVTKGASAYFFDRPEENRYFRIPVGGGANTIPAFGTGSLGYRPETDLPNSNTDAPIRPFSTTGVLLANVDTALRDPATNRAPVTVRLIPLIENLNIDAIDGTELRRSRPALFSGLGRKTLAGDRWGLPGGSGSASPAGASPYTNFPAELCQVAGCDTRISAEYEFRSSDPDIADFVQQDPSSTNLRKPLLNASGKPIASSQSGLLCAFNAGTTTVSVVAGGLSYSRKITVLDGSVRPPCGTTPLNPKRFSQSPTGARIPPSAPPPAATPPIALSLPPVPVAPKPPARPIPPTAIAEFVALPAVALPPRVIPPPPPPSLARPIPPTGGMSRVFEEKREEEAATEDSQAFARHYASQPPPVTWTLAGVAIVAALGLSTFTGRRGRPRTAQPAVARVRQTPQISPRRRRF